MKYYQEALDICCENRNHLTLNSIGIAILAEQIFFLIKSGKKYDNDRKKAANSLKDLLTKFRQSNLPDSLGNYFQEWNEDIINEQQGNKLFSLSRKVAY